MKINLVKEICDNCWLTMPELSEITGIKQQRLKDISAGRVDGFKAEDVSALVEKLHLSAEWLATGEGDVFKKNCSRDFPSKTDFMIEVLERAVRLVDPESVVYHYDQILDLPIGTTNKWIRKGAIPFSCIKKICDLYDVSYDYLIYGRGGLYQASQVAEFKERKVASETIAQNIYLTPREAALLDDFRSLSDVEKDAAETMLHAVAKHKVKKA